MKRILCILTIVLMVSGACCFCRAMDEDYPVFIGVKWGDSIDSVRKWLGYGKERSVMGVFTVLEYKNQKFGNDDAIYTLYLKETGLYSINILATDFKNPEEMSRICIEAFTDKYGEPKRTTVENCMTGVAEEVENGDWYLWIVNEDTCLYVKKLSGGVDIRFVQMKTEE